MAGNEEEEERLERFGINMRGIAPGTHSGPHSVNKIPIPDYPQNKLEAAQKLIKALTNQLEAERMWRLKAVERIKELEEALAGVLGVQPPPEGSTCLGT